MKQVYFFTLYLFSVLLFLLPLNSNSQSWSKSTIKGDGNVSKQIRSVSDFHSIEVSSGIDVNIVQGNAQIVVVETDENLQSELITKVENGVLKIYSEKWLKGTKGLDVNITVTFLKELVASGGADVDSDTEIKTDNFNLSASGGSDISIKIFASDISIEASGGSDINLEGTCNMANIIISGGSDVAAGNFIIKNCRLVASGGSDADINVTDELDAVLSGGSNVSYNGNAKIISKKLSGSSSLSKD